MCYNEDNGNDIYNYDLVLYLIKQTKFLIIYVAWKKLFVFVGKILHVGLLETSEDKGPVKVKVNFMFSS